MSVSHQPSHLAEVRILIAGLEPWGAVAAADLAAAGIRALHLLDDQRVTDDDLLAVRLFAEAHRGRERSEALAETLAREAPGCTITQGPLEVAADRPLAVQDLRWDLVLACVPGDDLIALDAVARFAHQVGSPLMHARLEGLDAIVGPGVIPGETACLRCARLRQLAHSHQPAADHALLHALLAERPRPRAHTYLAPMPGALGHALAIAALDLLVHARASRFAGRLWVQNLITLRSSFHAVIPMPWCETCEPVLRARALAVAATPLDQARDPAELRGMLEGILDVRTGLVRSVTIDQMGPVQAPELPIAATAILCDYTQGHYHGHCLHDPNVGAGKGLNSVEALRRAVGEAVERYAAGRFERHALRMASVASMQDDHLPPARLGLYSDSQYATPGFPFARLDPEMPIAWARGFWLDTRMPVYLPALATYYGFHVPREANFCQVTSNGLAAGPTLEDAALKATLELLERDAFMIAWLACRPGQRLQLDDTVDAGIREVVRQVEARGARVELFLIDAGAGLPVVVCVGFGDGVRWPGAIVGMAAHLSPRMAIRKAVLEQAHIGPYMCRRMAEGLSRIPAHPSDVRELEDHALYYLPASRAGAFQFLGAAGTVTAAELDEPRNVSLDVLLERLAPTGIRVAIADVTSPDLMGTPFRVARALGMDLQQIHFGHTLARLGNPRLLAMAPHGINPNPQPMA